DVKGAQGVGGSKRLLDVLHQRPAREIIPQGPAVHIPLSRSWRQIHSRDAGLPTAHSMPTQFWLSRRHFAFPNVTAAGCWATCGCSGPAYTLSFFRSACRASVLLGSIPNTA